MEKKYLDRILFGDCIKILPKLPKNSVDLIVTSPPYADNRKSTYSGIPIKTYVKWFLPISNELKRVLKPKGSFILNIKERTENGERGTYVIELILEMRKQGWLWTEEYIWHKKNSFPGKWPNRFRDSWERCLHFTKQKKFDMYQDSVKIPMGNWAEKRLKKLSKTDMKRDESKVKSGFGKKIQNWVGKSTVYPDNVLYFATVCDNRNHSAAFPLELPNWFIKLFSKKGDVILDPFLGSGTTALAAKTLQRHYVGMESNSQYYKVALKNIASLEPKKKNSRKSKVKQKESVSV